ncbi:MAG: Phage protein, partial [Gammaproteobacteria bacterium]|nr:Phage protein [Gammaproteobacteria bacterium]
MQTKLKTSGYRILINGKPLPANFISLITQISVQQELNVPSMFTISLTDLSFNQPGWQGIELDTFKPGDIISIAMGIEHYETLFIGQITALEPSFSNEAMLEVRGYDCMYWLKFGKYSRSFIKKTDGEIVAQIAKEVGIDVQVENTPLVNAYVLQNDQSNYDFLLQRLAQINYEMLVDGKKLIFRSSQEGMTPVKELRYPAEVSDLNLRLKVSTEGNKLTVVGWDVGKKQVVKAEVDSPSTKAKMGGQATGDSLASR